MHASFLSAGAAAAPSHSIDSSLVVDVHTGAVGEDLSSEDRRCIILGTNTSAYAPYEFFEVLVIWAVFFPTTCGCTGNALRYVPTSSSQSSVMCCACHVTGNRTIKPSARKSKTIYILMSFLTQPLPYDTASV